MKYMALLLTVCVLMSMGCASKQVELSPPDQQQLQSARTGKDESLQGRDKRLKEGVVEEEELAKRDRDRMRDAYLKDQKDASQFKDILFDFDSYAIRDEYFPRLNEIGNWLKRNKGAKITIEGHCDEKGTVEYNLALGQKRAESVKAYLVKSGVDTAKVKTISYGKELPADPGHTEDAWARNRRASIKID